MPAQCKLAQGTQVTAIGIASFGQDFDKDGFAGFNEIGISATWSEELNPLEQVRFECPPSPDGGTVIATIGGDGPPATLHCGLDEASQAEGLELAGKAWLAVTLTCTNVGIFQVRFETDVVREDFTSVPAKKTYNSVTKLTVTCVPAEKPTPAPAAKVFGDVDCNGVADSVDALVIIQFTSVIKGRLPCIRNGETNCDGRINALDAALILQYVAGLIDKLPQCSGKSGVAQSAVQAVYDDLRAALARLF